MGKRITEYHSGDWEHLVEQGWVTERVIEVSETDDPLWVLTQGKKRMAVMRKGGK